MPTYSSSVQVQAKPEEVWALISDGSRLTEWLSPVKTIEGEAPSQLSRGTDLKAVIGRVPGAKLKITEATPRRRLSGNAGPPIAHMMGMPVVMSVDLEGKEEATQVTFSIQANPLVAPMIKMTTGLDFEAEASKTAQGIKQAVESSQS